MFRRDLVARPARNGTTRYFEVSAPNSQRVLRFSEKGYAIAYMLNGKRTLKEFILALKSELGVVLSEQKAQGLIARLTALDCLAVDAHRTVPYEALQTVALFAHQNASTVEDAAARQEEYLDELVTIALPPSESKPSTPRRQVAQKRKSAQPPPIPGSALRPGKPLSPALVPGAAPRAVPRAPARALPPAVGQAYSQPPVHAASGRAPQAPPFAWPQQAYRLPQTMASFSPPVRHSTALLRQAGGRGRQVSAPYVSEQAIYLAFGFFAAATVWASWAIFRLF